MAQPCCSGLPRASDVRALEVVHMLIKWLMPRGGQAGRQGLIRELVLLAARGGVTGPSCVGCDVFLDGDPCCPRHWAKALLPGHF